MKIFLLFVLIVFAPGALTAAEPPAFQCAMHPWIKSAHPDKCTICGMELVPIAAGRDHSSEPNVISLSEASATVVGVRTAEVVRAPLVKTLRVAGVIDDDDTRHHILTTRVPGNIEKLLINYVGAEVSEGTPIAVVFSPAILTAERLFIERLQAGEAASSASERASSREQLLVLGLDEEDIVALERARTPSGRVTIRSPFAGTVVARWVYEGQQLNKDGAEKETRLFEIADFSSMWFIFDAHENDLSWLKVGQSVTVTTASKMGESITAPIAFIDPTLNEMTRTARVRVILPNHDHKLFHKQTAIGEVHVATPDVLVVPRSAVLQHRGSPLVYVERDGHAYSARAVQLGRVGDDLVEVVKGLTPGEHVVSEAGLMLDSQAQLAEGSTETVTEQKPAP